MKNCTKCKHAEWGKTQAGRLHPSGDGWCKKEIQIPQLPSSMYWLAKPCFSSGHINRRKDLKDHCVYYIEVGK